MAIANRPQAGTGLSRRAFVKTAALLVCGVPVGAGLKPARAASQETPHGITTSSPSSVREPRKLNVLFIMTDQHSARALGCYGNNEVRTPNMDRLAAGGVLFERAFCQTPQCVPSRYSIFTGRYARSHGTYSNGQTQNSQEQTVAEMFKRAGYATATLGKHHMVMGAATQNHGFDLVFNAPGTGLTRDGMFLPYDEVHPGRSPVGKTALSNDDHPAGVITTEAIEFLRAHRDRPFVLWYSFSGPHTPICPSAPWADWYDSDKLTLPPGVNLIDRDMPGVEGLLAKSGKYSENRYHRQTLAYYYGLVSQIDHNIGRVLDELDALGLSDNTIVVYTADHGEMMAEHGAWTKGRSGYDATIRVPLILPLPRVLPVGKRVSDLVCSICCPLFWPPPACRSPRTSKACPCCRWRGARPATPVNTSSLSLAMMCRIHASRFAARPTSTCSSALKAKRNTSNCSI
jgi:arylsulfatase A-like enzyme